MGLKEIIALTADIVKLNQFLLLSQFSPRTFSGGELRATGCCLHRTKFLFRLERRM